LVANPDEEKYKSYPNGGFLDGKEPHDPWKNPYIYTNDESTIDILSLGADGKEGGNGEAADIAMSSCNK